MHGGDIRVESEINKGSNSIFTIPIATTQATKNTIPTITQNFADEDIIEHHEIEPDSSSNTILIVDDEPINLQIIKNPLSIYDYNFIECSSGEAALYYLKNKEQGDK